MKKDISSRLNLWTVKDLCNKHHQWLEPHKVRDWLFRNPNEFRERVVVRIGRRIYLDEDCLISWLREQNPGWRPVKDEFISEGEA